MANNDLFSNDDTNTADVNYVEVMTQKFKDSEGKLDVQALAKGKHESDRFIDTLKAELEELRRDNHTRISLEEFVTKTRTNASNSQPTREIENEENKAKNEAVMSKDDIAKITQDVINQERMKATREQNTNQVRSELITLYGNNYVDKITQITSELGVGKDFMADLAATQPKAFLKLVADNTQTSNKPNDSIPPRSTIVNRTTNSKYDANVKNSAYYQHMKQIDPKKYFSKEIAIEMDRNALRMGEAFFV